MNIRIEINTDNAAFENNPAQETARILKRLADGLEHGVFTWGYIKNLTDGYSMGLSDGNGNTVGKVTSQP